jgi:hypothetical protein
MDQPTITLCFPAFSNEAAPWETIADMAADPNSNQEGRNLDNQMPRLVTLMHEMIHLVCACPILNRVDNSSKSNHASRCKKVLQTLQMPPVSEDCFCVILSSRVLTKAITVKAQECLKLIAVKKNFVAARTNPESYPFMSLSYWLTQNRRGGGANSPYIDWSKDISENWRSGS